MGEMLQAVLSPELNTAFVTKVAAHIAKNLETLLMRKRFNQLGAMQVCQPTLSKSVCVVSSYCDNSVREKDWRYRKRGMQAT